MRDFIMRNLGHIHVEPIKTEYARHLLNLFTGGNLRFAPTAHLTTQSSIPSLERCAFICAGGAKPSLTGAGEFGGLQGGLTVSVIAIK